MYTVYTNLILSKHLKCNHKFKYTVYQPLSHIRTKIFNMLLYSTPSPWVVSLMVKTLVVLPSLHILVELYTI